MTREQSADFRRRKHASSGGCGGWTRRVRYIPHGGRGAYVRAERRLRAERARGINVGQTLA